MKIREVISHLDSIKPNAYKDEDKLKWLKELEQKIYNEIVLTHENPCDMTDFSNEDSELIVSTPYDSIYTDYLGAKIDFYNNETTRYNNQMMMFNQSYYEFGNFYNRTHLPISKE